MPTFSFGAGVVPEQKKLAGTALDQRPQRAAATGPMGDDAQLFQILSQLLQSDKSVDIVGQRNREMSLPGAAWGPNGVFKTSLSQQISPEALAASQGPTAVNQWNAGLTPADFGVGNTPRPVSPRGVDSPMNPEMLWAGELGGLTPTMDSRPGTRPMGYGSKADPSGSYEGGAGLYDPSLLVRRGEGGNSVQGPFGFGTAAPITPQKKKKPTGFSFGTGVGPR